jgi:dihydroorotase
MKILLRQGRVVDPANNLDDIRDILIVHGKIEKVASFISAPVEQTIDCKGKVIIPGIVDMHVHLREPGREDKETIASGTKAALKGGVTTILAMPNTNPAIDSVEHVRLLKSIIKETAQANVVISAAITKGRLGKELTEISKLKKEGIVAITDDGSSVDSSLLLSKALRKAKEHKIAVICHCEDNLLSGNGVVNLGAISTRLGLRGISKESEYKRVQRDIQLAEKSKCYVHIAHVSCKESVEIIGKAKRKGIKVTAETAPHYFALSEEELLTYDTNMKMNPPLRGKADVAAIKQGLIKGVIDVIASDHAPHTISEKDVEFDRAEFGIIGLETELAVCITELIFTRLLTWSDLVRRISLMPAKILGIDKGTLSEGKAADLVVIDPNKEWVVQKEGLVSKSKNSPFIGRQLKGVVEYTVFGGKIAYKSQ